MSIVEQSVSFFVEKKTLQNLLDKCKVEDTGIVHFSVTTFTDGNIVIVLVPAKALIGGIPKFYSEGNV